MHGDFRLGDWLVQPTLCRLSKDGRTVHVRPKVMDLLAYLAANTGEIVSKDRLLHDVWQTEAVTESTLTRTVTELRQALGDDAGQSRLIETIPKRGYRLIVDVGAAEAPPTAPAPEGHQADGPAGGLAHGTRPGGRQGMRGALIVAGSALVVVAVVLVLRATWTTTGARPGPSRSAEPAVERLTFEPGLQIDPGFSPDGRYLVYASNERGDFDIWVRPVAGGDPLRLTSHPAHDWQPSWAPDGASILFRSERTGGGIFRVPAFGGAEERLTSFGYRPRWSPDGSRFLFVSALVAGATSGRVYVGETNGREPREIAPPDTLGPWPGQLAASVAPNVVWHPDGQRLSFLACSCQSRDFTLFTFDPASGAVVRSAVDPGVADTFRRLNLQTHDTEPIAWSRTGDELYFVGFTNTLDVWKVDVHAATLRIVGGPRRLTSGAGVVSQLAIAGDSARVAYVQQSGGSRVRVFQLEDGGRRVVGSGRPVTPAEIEVGRPDMTRDGRKLLFLAMFPGAADRGELRELTLADGRARVLRALRGDVLFTPRFSRDGSRVAYRYSPSEHPMRRSIRVLNLDELREWPLTSPVDGISDNAWDWSADGRHVLASGGRYRAGHNAIAFVPLAGAPTAERQARIVTSDRERALWQAMLSPNGRWVAFEAVPLRDASATALHVVAADGGPWVAITDGTAFDDKPRWSDDGRLLYFLSSRGGVPNVWAAPMNPDSGRPSGPPFQLTHFDGRTSIAVPHVAFAELAVGGGRLALQIAEPSASIWMLDPAGS